MIYPRGFAARCQLSVVSCSCWSTVCGCALCREELRERGSSSRGAFVRNCSTSFV